MVTMQEHNPLLIKRKWHKQDATESAISKGRSQKKKTGSAIGKPESLAKISVCHVTGGQINATQNKSTQKLYLVWFMTYYNFS